MKKDYPVIDNRDGKRFEIHEEGHIAFEDYELFDGDIAYLHTEVPPELAGRGIASFLIRYILNDAAAKGLKVKPVCPLVKAYIDKHPEYQANSLLHGATL